jgi:hypothetical protein
MMMMSYAGLIFLQSIPSLCKVTVQVSTLWTCSVMLVTIFVCMDGTQQF